MLSCWISKRSCSGSFAQIGHFVGHIARVALWKYRSLLHSSGAIWIAHGPLSFQQGLKEWEINICCSHTDEIPFPYILRCLTGTLTNNSWFLFGAGARAIHTPLQTIHEQLSVWVERQATAEKSPAALAKGSVGDFIWFHRGKWI